MRLRDVRWPMAFFICGVWVWCGFRQFLVWNSRFEPSNELSRLTARPRFGSSSACKTLAKAAEFGAWLYGTTSAGASAKRRRSRSRPLGPRTQRVGAADPSRGRAQLCAPPAASNSRKRSRAAAARASSGTAARKLTAKTNGKSRPCRRPWAAGPRYAACARPGPGAAARARTQTAARLGTSGGNRSST